MMAGNSLIRQRQLVQCHSSMQYGHFGNQDELINQRLMASSVQYQCYPQSGEQEEDKPIGYGAFGVVW